MTEGGGHMVELGVVRVVPRAGKLASIAEMNDRFRDLRVDDHPRPIEELYRIYKIHRKTFPRPDQKLDSEN